MAASSELLYSYDTHDIFDVFFDGDRITTTVTQNPSIVTNWINEIQTIHRRRLGFLIVGFDVEWRPSFHRGHQNPVAVLQLCVGRRCLIFQIIHAPQIPRSLIDFLSHRHYTFVGVGIDRDVERLDEDYGLRVINAEDIGCLAADCLGSNGLRNAGLKTLAFQVLGREVLKPRNITMSRWDSEWLSHAQIQYACVDAFVSFEMGRSLMSDY